jgi:hypothetical protein
MIPRKHSPPILLAILAPVLLAAGAMAACGDDDDDAPPSETPAVSASETVRPTDASGTPSVTEEPFADGSRAPSEGAGSPAGATGILVNIRIARHVDYDRITFEFREDARPPYHVEYVQPPIIADASGLEVEIAGSAFLRIRMEPAAGHDPNTGEETYGGTLELNPGLPALVEAERTGDFEGVLQWVMGLAEETDFRVVPLDDPPRIAVDVKHPTGG